MSQLITAALLPPAGDPFAIGWRDVCRTLPDGSTVWEQIPLTLEDALHPQEDDKIATSTVHTRICTYLQNVIEQRVEVDPSALVLADCNVLWPDGVHHCPDIAVVFGVREVRDNYSQFDTAAEGVRPRLIIEVVSPNVRVNDVDKKMAAYHKYRVPFYVIIDREDEDATPELFGHHWTPRGYRALTPEADGRLWLEPVGIYLGVRDGRVVAYDGDTEQELGNYAAVTAALAGQQARADAEQQRADAERQRADAAQAHVDAERARADTERTRADTERARADALEARLRQLEAGREPPAAP